MTLETQPLTLKILDNGIVSQYQQFQSTKKHFKFEIKGNVFEANSKLVPEGTRESFHGDHVWHNPEEVLNKDSIKDCHFIKGRTLYAGHFMNHYGHFITEGLGRLYPLTKSIKFDHIAFLPFIFENQPKVELLSDFHRIIFMALGILPKNIIFVDKLTCFEEFWVPSPAWPINSAAHPVMSKIYSKIRNIAGSTDFSSSADKTDLKKIFISRSKNIRSGHNSEVENLFSENGFFIFAPENKSFLEQLSVYTKAKFLAGFSGSGLHNILFCKPDASLIEITDLRSGGRILPMQAAANSIESRKSITINHNTDLKLMKKMLIDFTSGQD